MENVNKGGRRASKHVELWVKNAFDEHRLFCGFNATKSIVDIFEDESSIKNLMKMSSTFVL
jgi:hypothetical protein